MKCDNAIDRLVAFELKTPKDSLQLVYQILVFHEPATRLVLGEKLQGWEHLHDLVAF